MADTGTADSINCNTGKECKNGTPFKMNLVPVSTDDEAKIKAIVTHEKAIGQQPLLNIDSLVIPSPYVLDKAIDILDDLGSSASVQSALARAYLYKFQSTKQPELAASARASGIGR